MKDARKRKIVSNQILKNLKRLIECADILAQHKHYGPAIHLALAAREEAVKWLVLFAWEYLDQRIKGRIYNHLLKHELAGLFYYLSGKIQASEFVTTGLALLARRDSDKLRDANLISEHIWNEFHPRDPKCLAAEITHFMFVMDRSKYEGALKDSLKLTERKRTASIYVDFGTDYKVEMSPASFKASDYRSYRRDVLLAQYYIQELLGRRPDRKILHQLFPEWKKEFRDSIAKLRARLAETRHRASNER
jgi:AbiV family abortive infection protein